MAAPLFGGPVRFLGSFPGALPAPTLPEVAFAGRSNVGKSSAINVLLGTSVARTSSTPGRTQHLNLFDIGGKWIVVDLPGYGYAKVSHRSRDDWRAWIGEYLARRETLKLVVTMLDVRVPPQESDHVLIAALADLRIPTLALATKVDAITRGKRAAAVAALAKAHGLHPDTVVPFSSTEKIGVEDARGAIVSVLKG